MEIQLLSDVHTIAEEEEFLTVSFKSKILFHNQSIITIRD